MIELPPILVAQRFSAFRLVWRRASALRRRSPEGLRHYSDVETAVALRNAPSQG